MSSDRLSDVPSSPAEPADWQLGLAAVLRTRGEPLVEALERHQPGAGEHAEATASYAFAIAVELGFEPPRPAPATRRSPAPRTRATSRGPGSRSSGLARGAGNELDPQVVAALTAILERAARN